MKKIRTGVWETNSSSCHSLSVEDTDVLLDYLIPNKEGIVAISPDEFGWEWLKYNDAYTKASYCLTGVQYVEDKDTALSNLKEVIKEHTLCEKVYLQKLTYSYDENGYIDHQSIEDGQMDELLFDKAKLHNFIFNKNSWLFLGNDNSNAPNKFYDTEDLHYKWKLVVEKYPTLTWEFVDYPTNENIKDALYALDDEVDTNSITESSITFIRRSFSEIKSSITLNYVIQEIN